MLWFRSTLVVAYSSVGLQFITGVEVDVVSALNIAFTAIASVGNACGSNNQLLSIFFLVQLVLVT